MTLLSAQDPAPFIFYPAKHETPFLLVCDHAGRHIPAVLTNLGLSPDAMARHIAWDIGIAQVARRLHQSLGAPLIEQVYSRLVIDCNRAPGHETSIPIRSDGTVIPGNQNLSRDARTAREAEIFQPYHDRVALELDQNSETLPAIISLHSFTPIWQNQRRRWDAGVLYHRDEVSAKIMHRLLVREGLTVGENEPYRMTATSDYTIPHHAEKRSLPYLEIEIRQDLLETEAGQNHWATLLTDLLPTYWRERSKTAWTAPAYD